jgi:hypothetical protein
MEHHRLHLSVTDLPFSENGIACCAFMVNVSDEHGRPVHGLQAENFNVRWILDNELELDLQQMTVAEYVGQGALPKLPGVYDVELFTKSGHWSPTSANINVFAFYVRHGHDHGQVLYKVTDPSIAI